MKVLNIGDILIYSARRDGRLKWIPNLLAVSAVVVYTSREL